MVDGNLNGRKKDIKEKESKKDSNKTEMLRVIR